MIKKYSVHPDDFKKYDTTKIREEFLMEKLFEEGKVLATYSFEDRIIFGGIMPSDSALKVDELATIIHSDNFLDGREMGVINIGGDGYILIDGEKYEMLNSDGIYIPKDVKEVEFYSTGSELAKFYFSSAPAHHAYDIKHIKFEDAKRVELGSATEMNERVIHQYVHPAVCDSCQLIMGMTKLSEGSGWNTMPSHTHERRMEVYFYFDMQENTRVFHLVGAPEETRHIVMANEQATISPSWSIHAGAGTAAYTFIWAMCGENKTFEDMDSVPMSTLK